MQRARKPPAANNLLDGLAKVWEDNENIRRNLLATSALMKWPKPTAVGVVSFEAVALNYDVMLGLIQVWCGARATPKCAPVTSLKREAGSR